MLLAHNPPRDVLLAGILSFDYQIGQTDPSVFIGQKVEVTIDRPLGSVHPKFPNLKYFVNYGYIPGTLAGDGKELDVYILGVGEPLSKFEGECIAYIHRKDDDDDKLIVVPHGMTLSDEEILEQTYFQEKYFEATIVRI